MQKTTNPEHLPPSAWADWPYFLAAYRAGSLSGAATALRVEQSTVSRRVARLEEVLGHELFHRGPSGLVPTEVALLMVPQVERSESALLDALTAASGHGRQVAGRVRVACPESMAYAFLVPALPRLYAMHPELQIELRTGYGVVDLTRREADIGVRGVPPREPEHVGRAVARFSVGLFAHRRWESAARQSIPWIGTSGVFEHFPEGQWDKSIRRRPTLLSDSYMARYAAVDAGIGCTLLPRPWGRAQPHLFEIDLPKDTRPPPVRTIYLVVHRALRRVPRVSATWDFLAETLQTLDAGDDLS